MFTKENPPEGTFYCEECLKKKEAVEIVPIVSKTMGFMGTWVCPKCQVLHHTSVMMENPYWRTAAEIITELQEQGLTLENIRGISDRMTRDINGRITREAIQEEHEADQAEAINHLNALRRAQVAGRS